MFTKEQQSECASAASAIAERAHDFNRGGLQFGQVAIGEHLNGVRGLQPKHVDRSDHASSITQRDRDGE